MLLDLTQWGVGSSNIHVVISQWGFTRLCWRDQFLYKWSQLTYNTYSDISRSLGVQSEDWFLSVPTRYLQHGMWNVGERRWFCRFCHTAITQLWLSTDSTTWAVAILISKTTGSCQVHAGCDAEECFHNLVCIILLRLKLDAWIFHYLMMSNRKYTLLCKYKVRVWVAGFLCATYRESGNWCVSSPQGRSGDGPSSQRYSTGSWFPVQSPCACCSDTSESNEQLAHANNRIVPLTHHYHCNLIRVNCGIWCFTVLNQFSGIITAMS